MGNSKILTNTYILSLILFYILNMAIGVFIPIGSPITNAFNIFLFLIIVACNFYKPRFINKFGFIYLYLSFLMILILLTSSNQFYSLKMRMKYASGLMALPLGFYLFDNLYAIKKTWLTLVIFTLFFLANFYLSNLFDLGIRVYGVKDIHIGNLFDNSLYINVCILFIAPFFLCIFNKYKSLVFIALALNTTISIIVLKRTVILCFIASFIVFILLFLYLNYKKGQIKYERGKINKGHIVLLIIAFLTSAYIYYPSFQEVAKNRERSLQKSYAEEGRGRELKIIYEEIVNSPSDKEFFFGKETFNTIGTYAGGDFGERMIHENYGIILNGTGVIGFIFYISVNIYFLVLFFKYSKRVDLKQSIIGRYLFIGFIILYLIYFLSSFSGSIWLSLYPITAFTLMGMCLRYFYEYGEVDYDVN